MENKAVHRISAGGIVLNGKGEVLVVSQHGSSWSLPKGGIDPGEDEIAAAKREIYEEAGVKDLEYLRPLGSYQRYRIAADGSEDLSIFKTIHMMLFRTTQDILAPVDPENPEARWVKKENVAELLTHPKDKEFFLKFIDKV